MKSFKTKILLLSSAFLIVLVTVFTGCRSKKSVSVKYGVDINSYMPVPENNQNIPTETKSKV